MIYLDHASTTPMHPKVIEKMVYSMNKTFGNPSSVHNFGRSAFNELEKVREIVASSLNVQTDEIIFNGGGTEGDNSAVIGVALSKKNVGKHIITTSVEHPAILKAMKFLEKQGFNVSYLPVDEKGNLNVNLLKSALKTETILVSIMFANNETGNLMPIKSIGKLLLEHPAIFHTDAVQVYGKISISPLDLNIDLLTASAHKINGPKGIGFLFKKEGIKLFSCQYGGKQERGYRPGTENLPAIVGMGEAIILRNNFEQSYYAKLMNTLIRNLTDTGIKFSINGDIKNNIGNILNLWIHDVSSDLLLPYLDLKGIAVSSGSACTSRIFQPSHVLVSMKGKKSSVLKQSIRISLGLGNTLEDIHMFTEYLVDIVKKLKV